VVKGADRDTAEEVEFVVDAQTPEEATAKANRRGILVDRCLSPSETLRVNPLVSQEPTPPRCPRATPETNSGWHLLRRILTITVLFIAGGCLFFYKVYRPRQQAIQETLRVATEQNERASAKRKEADQLEVYILRLKAKSEEAKQDQASQDEFRRIVTNNGKRSFREAIENDPIIGPVSREHPGLAEAIMSNESLTLWSFMKGIPEDKITVDERRYITNFAQAMQYYSH
jgi:hypothetical protein